jgi:hypothetical protein
MLKEGWKFKKKVCWCFQVGNKVANMYKISCIHPMPIYVLGSKQANRAIGAPYGDYFLGNILKNLQKNL